MVSPASATRDQLSRCVGFGQISSKDMNRHTMLAAQVDSERLQSVDTPCGEDQIMALLRQSSSKTFSKSSRSACDESSGHGSVFPPDGTPRRTLQVTNATDRLRPGATFSILAASPSLSIDLRLSAPMSPQVFTGSHQYAAAEQCEHDQRRGCLLDL